MKRLFAAAVAAACFATPAFAQDAAPFTGPRVELLVGYESVGIPEFKNPDGLLYGLGVGYDFQSGSALFGIEAEIADSTTKLKVGGDKIESDRDIYVGARVGTLVGDKAALFLKGGYTNARFESDFVSGNGDGWRVGAALEYAMSGNTFVKGEYRYSDYEGGFSRNQVVGGFGFRF